MENELPNKFGLGIKTQIYNHEMRSRRSKLGLSQNSLGAHVNMPAQYITQIETFKWYPAYEKLEDIAVVLETTVDILFPEWLREQKVKKSSFDQVVMVEKMSLEAPEVNLLEAPDDINDLVENSMLHKDLMEILNALTEREQKILKMRFGLEDGKSHSLEEVGQELSTTRERIRQIEAKALAKLRKHKDADKLADYISLKYGDKIRENGFRRAKK